MKEIIYKVINLMTLGKGFERQISGFKVRIPTRFYKYFESDYELNNVNFINNYVSEGMQAIDVGAHIGLLSVIIARKLGSTGKVYSFEPTPSTFALLKKTVEINDLQGVVVPMQKAVSDKPGKTVFYVTDIEAHNSNSLANNKRDYGNEHGLEVLLTNIDTVKEEMKMNRVDLLKIDAEGAEYSVLKGATKVIDEFKPKIVLGLHPKFIVNFGDSLAEIWDFAMSKNYRVFYKSDEITKEFFVSQTDLFDVFFI